MLNAIIELAMMGAVVAAYGLLARRYRALWHPLSIVVAVVIVSVVVSVLGEALFGSGWIGVPMMLRRSAIAGFGWGVVVAAVVWVVRRGFVIWTTRRRFQ